MATRIDTALIEGYADMSAEDKVKALEAFEYDDHAAELEKAKAAISKANSESAEWKRKHNALLSEEDKKKQQAEEDLQKILEENKNLKRDRDIAQYKAHFLKLGYSENLADSSATAMCDGDNETLLKNQEAYKEEYKKAVIAEAMKGTPYPAGGSVGKVDYSKDIEAARARGDFATVAAYTRLQQEQLKPK